jgi:hypothetical protein
MLLAIFGAGASYDSVDLTVTPSLARSVAAGTSYRPPLTSELFDERPAFVAAMNQWPQIAPLIPQLRRATTEQGDQTVEEVLRAIQEQAETYPQRISHLVALEYYLAEITNTPIWEWFHNAGGSTNYAEVLDQIEQVQYGKNRSLFVTFNYDYMLESAFDSVLMRDFRRVDDYIPPGESALIRPHGSINWAQCLPTGSQPDLPGDHAPSVIKYAPQLRFSGGPIFTRTDARGAVWHPAIAVPLDRGKTFICPPEHLDRLETDLVEVTCVLIVGWRATEAHFLNVLNEKMRKDRSLSLCIVDMGINVSAVRDNLQKALEYIRFDPIELHDQGFSAFVRERRVCGWLSEST